MQIEHLERLFNTKSHSRKFLKKMRNRLIRRIKKTEIPHVGYFGWEY